MVKYIKQRREISSYSEGGEKNNNKIKHWPTRQCTTNTNLALKISMQTQLEKRKEKKKKDRLRFNLSNDFKLYER